MFYRRHFKKSPWNQDLTWQNGKMRFFSNLPGNWTESFFFVGFRANFIILLQISVNYLFQMDFNAFKEFLKVIKR